MPGRKVDEELSLICTGNDGLLGGNTGRVPKLVTSGMFSTSVNPDCQGTFLAYHVQKLTLLFKDHLLKLLSCLCYDQKESKI